ncbi:MAG: hypothetical protein E7231_03315 [Cellulosilyticum sp.]|nr:hypothetical protein [Cellulosilyticum sp.]
MILKKIKNSLCVAMASFLTITSMPIMANEWQPVYEENVTSSSDIELYYHLGMGYHVTWQRTNGQWTDGAPGSNQTATINLSKNEIMTLANNVPGLAGKTIKDVKVKLYRQEDEAIPDWNDKRFGYWPTVKNGGRNSSGTVTGKGSADDFFENYPEYFAQNIRLDNDSIKYNSSTGTLSYKYSYTLSTVETSATDKMGFRIHYIFRNYRRFFNFSQSESKTNADINDYLGTTPAVTYEVLENNNKTSATFYILPLLYVFEAESDKPGVTITAPPEEEKVICAPATNSGPIQLLVNRAKVSWQKTTGKVIFTDATGKNKDFRIEKEIPASAYKNNYLLMTWCIPYETEKLLVTFIPDPSNPDEKYESEYERNPNDMGVTDIKLQLNNKNVSAPTIGNEHTIKVDVANLGNKVVKEPTVDITVTEKDKTVLVKETVSVSDDLKEKGTVTIPLDKVKPSTNEIEVCAIINQDKHTVAGDNIANENDKLCKTFAGVQDMGISSNVTLLGRNGETTEFVPGEEMTVVFRPKHVVGSEAVGTHDTLNPKATIKVTITDANNDLSTSSIQ